MNCYRVFTCLLVALSLCTTAQAQSVPDFLALDVFGGLAGLGGATTPPGEEEKASPHGWNLGTTVRFRPWLGLKGEMVRTHDGYGGRQAQYVGGIEVASAYSGASWYRGLAHALVGSVRNRARDGSFDQGPELVLGGGFDLLVMVRMQFDYVRMSVLGLPKNNGRIYFGGVLPLCVTGCRREGQDGIPVRKP